ncbi:MAG: TonB family protein [Deltaproteobacteria bacterium]|nr:TonB family protein [Deltaproteobacteria bacterium]
MSGARSISLPLVDTDSEPKAPQKVAAPVAIEQQPAAPFAHFMVAHQRIPARTRGKQSLLLAFVAVLHVAAFAAVARQRLSGPRQTKPPVHLLLPRLAPPPPPPVAAVATVKAESAAPLRKGHAAPPPPPPTPTPVAAPVEVPAAPVAAPSEAPVQAAGPVGDPQGPATGGIAAGVVGGTGTAAVTAPVAAVAARTLDPSERRRLLEQYLREIMASSINKKRFYPAEAEEAGLQGVVVVRVVIDGAGRLQGASVITGDHMPVLAHAAVKTIQLAQPFPPPPEILGGRVQVDVTLNYELP